MAGLSCSEKPDYLRSCTENKALLRDEPMRDLFKMLPLFSIIPPKLLPFDVAGVSLIFTFKFNIYDYRKSFIFIAVSMSPYTAAVVYCTFFTSRYTWSMFSMPELLT